MPPYFEDPRRLHAEIMQSLRALHRKVDRMLEELIEMDIFDKIAAALTAKAAGDDSALKDHVASIDAHLSQLDSADTDEQTRLSNIEQGLQKVADAIPAATPAPATSGDQGGAAQGDTSGASVGDQSGDVGAVNPNPQPDPGGTDTGA